MADKNRFKQAFTETYNTLGIVGVIGLSCALLNPVPLLAGIVIEAAYLLFVPDSKWYAQRVEAKYDAEVRERHTKLRDQIFPSLDIETRNRYSKLEALRTQIDVQVEDGKPWFRQVLRKLDYLLEKFLLFASKQVQFQAYLRSVLSDAKNSRTQIDPVPPKTRSVPANYDEAWVKSAVAQIQKAYDVDIEALKVSSGEETNLHNQAILEKRREVITRRREYVSRIGEILSNLNQQLHLMEDTFGLINDEIRARSPEQVLADIDGVVLQTDSLTEALLEVAPFDEATLPEGGDKLYNGA